MKEMSYLVPTHVIFVSKLVAVRDALRARPASPKLWGNALGPTISVTSVDAVHSLTSVEIKYKSCMLIKKQIGLDFITQY